jgi:polyadenylate-binding protein
MVGPLLLHTRPLSLPRLQEFGEIVNTKIMRDSSTKVPRGFGFVLFAEAAQAAKAVAEMNDKILDGKKLYVSLAQSKAARQQQMQEMIKNNMMPSNMALPYGGRGMNPMPPGMQGMNMGYMQAYPGMMPYGLGRGQMMANPMQFQMGGRNVQGGGGAASMKQNMQNAGNPVMMPGGMPMQFMPNGMIAPGMMNAAGMMHPAMGGGQRGRGRGRGQGRGGQGPQGPGRMPGFVGGNRNAGRGGQAQRGAAMQIPPPEAHQMPPAPVAEESNLAAKLANMAEPTQKQHLGELLYPKVQDMLLSRYGADNAAKLASKVTGMFLEMDTPGLLYLLDTEAECSTKIEEALDVLRQHNAMPEGCA